MERIRNVTMLTDNPHLNLFVEDAVKRNGKQFHYYFASRRRGGALEVNTRVNVADGVLIYALAGERHDRLVLIRQFRYPINDYIYELPAGLVEPDETVEDAAVREFMEETGMELNLYTGGNPACRKPFYTTVGMTDESVASVYGFASGEPSTNKMEESEDIRTVLADRDEVRRILREEKVAMKCALLMMQFLHAAEEQPFAFLEE